jgi:hypothetical protein
MSRPDADHFRNSSAPDFIVGLAEVSQAFLTMARTSSAELAVITARLLQAPMVILSKGSPVMNSRQNEGFQNVETEYRDKRVLVSDASGPGWSRGAGKTQLHDSRFAHHWTA